jgi:hypothetical protein
MSSQFLGAGGHERGEELVGGEVILRAGDRIGHHFSPAAQLASVGARRPRRLSRTGQ